jgi:deoxyribonucleoside regulator
MANITINEINTLIRIAKKYYEAGLSQEQISQEEEISKSTVSRLLDKAEKLGYIKHHVIYPNESMVLQEKLHKKGFDIERIFVSPTIVDNDAICLIDTCKMAAEDLAKIVSDNDIISVSWGRTMEQLAEVLVPPAVTKEGIRIVQLNGSIATSVLSTRTAGILQKFMEAYSGIGYMMAAPALVDNKDIAEAIKRDSKIKQVLDMACEASIAVFTIGQTSEHSVLVERGSISLDEVKRLQDLGAVGDICSRYFDIQGRIVSSDFEARAIGIALNQLKLKKQRIGIAVGTEKVDAIIGALRGGYLTTLYTDEKAAAGILKRCEEIGF